MTEEFVCIRNSVKSQSLQVWSVTWADISYSSKTPETADVSFPAACVWLYFYILICLVSSTAGPSNSNAYTHTYLSPLMRPALWSHKHYSTPGNKCGCVYVCLGVYILYVAEKLHRAEQFNPMLLWRHVVWNTKYNVRSPLLVVGSLAGALVLLCLLSQA